MEDDDMAEATGETGSITLLPAGKGITLKPPRWVWVLLAGAIFGGGGTWMTSTAMLQKRAVDASEASAGINQGTLELLTRWHDEQQSRLAAQDARISAIQETVQRTEAAVLDLQTAVARTGASVDALAKAYRADIDRLDADRRAAGRVR